jgi:hypothetical protein
VQIKTFTEKKINKQVIEKLKPDIENGEHPVAIIEVKGKIVARVKLPNQHTREMSGAKSQHIANGLMLSDVEFNSLVECPLSGTVYNKLIEKKLSHEQN